MSSADAIIEPAPAKINLALHVRRRRDDGYHDLETLFAFARGGDTVTVQPAEQADFSITGPFATALDAGADNLVVRAAAAFRAAFALDTPHVVVLEKRLPVASGIGGGSADAAATLRALARLHDVVVDDPRLRVIAASLGADVPACLLGRVALGTGKGDTLEPLPPLGDVPALLVNPGVAVSTAQVFARWDGVDRGPLSDGPALQVAVAGRNDLTDPAIAVAPVIGEMLDRIANQPGTTFVRMSGSGATCFALFDSVAAQSAAAVAIATARPGWWCFETALV